MAKSKSVGRPEKLNTCNANPVVVFVLLTGGGSGGGYSGEEKSNIVTRVQLHNLGSRDRGVEPVNSTTRVLNY